MKMNCEKKLPVVKSLHTKVMVSFMAAGGEGRNGVCSLSLYAQKTEQLKFPSSRCLTLISNPVLQKIFNTIRVVMRRRVRWRQDQGGTAIGCFQISESKTQPEKAPDI